jgi:hypothetical protein
MQRLHIGYGVHDAAWPQSVRIFRIQGRRYNPCLVLSGFEVRVGEADEDFADLCLFKEIGKKFHRVGADARRVLVKRTAVLFA